MNDGWSGLVEAKRSLRIRMKRIVGSLSDDELFHQGEAAAEALQGTPFWRDSSTILAFASMAGEIATEPIISAAFASGRRLLVPRTGPSDIGFVDLGACGGLPALSPRGPFGIPEPPLEAPDLPPEDFGESVLVLVPGLAFDPSGRRLGRGAGYYDRFVDRLGRAGIGAVLVGFCLREQLVPEVPQGPEDLRLRAVVAGPLVVAP